MMDYLSINLFAFMPIIFFVYGLAFLMLGVTIGLETFSFSQPRRFPDLLGSPWGALSVFAVLHGIYEVMGSFNLLYGGLILPLKIMSLYLMPLSFYFLCKFGVSYGESRGYFAKLRVLPGSLAAVWLVLSSVLLIRGGLGEGAFTNASILSRYIMGFPGAVMASFALVANRKAAAPKSQIYLAVAAGSLAFYAVALCITQKAGFFPAAYFNYEDFFRAVHVPAQVLRTLCALVIAFSFIRLFQLSRDFTGIRFKAVMHVMVAVVVPAFCIILLASYLMSDALLRVSYKENEKLASLAAHGIQASLLNVEKGLKYSMFFARLDRTPVEDFLAPFLMEDADINNVAFFDTDGEILRVRRDPSSLAINFSGHSDGLRLRNFLAEAALGGFHMGRHDDKSVSMVFPLPAGRIEVLLDLGRLYESIENLRTGKDWHVLLVDARGGLVVHGSGRRPTRQAVFKEPGAHRDIYGETTAENGTLYNAIEAKIDPIGWSLITEIPRSELVAPIFDLFKGLLAGVLLIYLSAVAAVILSLGKVTAPIGLIAERVKSIGRGDLTSAVNIKTGDEVQTLSEEVEKMAMMLVEKKEMEKRLIQTQKIASLGRLVSGVAHEINNPLSVIIWSSQLLLREFKPGDRHHEDLKMLEKHALACKKIVDDLLRFSRTGKQMDIAVDLNRNIEETFLLIGKLIRGNNIAVIFDFDLSSPEVRGDPDKLHQVFLNLAVNAVDAMKKGGGTLTVRTSLSDSGPERSVEVNFTDTGCGISPEDLERIFDPFFTTKEAGEGTGLGLSVSYGIVSDHNGRMWVESVEGKGSTFHIVLPALKNDSQETA